MYSKDRLDIGKVEKIFIIFLKSSAKSSIAVVYDRTREDLSCLKIDLE